MKWTSLLSGIVFNEGASWKAHRAFLHHEFRKFSFSGQSIELPIQLSADELIEQLRVRVRVWEATALAVTDASFFFAVPRKSKGSLTTAT